MYHPSQMGLSPFYRSRLPGRSFQIVIKRSSRYNIVNDKLLAIKARTAYSAIKYRTSRCVRPKGKSIMLLLLSHCFAQDQDAQRTGAFGIAVARGADRK